MAANDYRFVTHWRVYGTLQEVSEVLWQPEEYPLWWPAVYLSARRIASGNGDGVGRSIALVTKGWLPYMLSWTLRVTRSRQPHEYEFEAEGDFVGGGRWILESSGAWVNVTLEWEVRADKTLVALLSPALRPVFAANHRWAMRRGEESLVLELARRRAATSADRDRVPLPPGPTTTSPVPMIVGGAAVLLLLGAALREGSRRNRSRRSG
jgi:hypothetical protein